MNRKIETRKSERGIAMMVALLALLLLAAIGMGLMFMADTENSVNNNYRDAQKAYFAARAGAEQARLLMTKNVTVNTQAINMDGHMPANGVPAAMFYLTNPTGGEVIDPTATGTYSDDQLCWEKYPGLLLTTGSGPCGSNGQVGQILTSSGAFATLSMSAPGSGGSDALPFKWVRVTNKQNLMGPIGKLVDSTAAVNQQVCWDGSKEVVIALGSTCENQVSGIPMMPVWELTSLAVTPKLGANPGSRRIVQEEVALNPPLLAPAPISTQAPVNLQGSFILNAYDNCTCTCTTTGSGNNTTTTCGVGQPLCKNKAHAVFTASTVQQTGGSGQTTTSYGTNPEGSASVQNVNPWPANLNIDNLIKQYSTGATIPSFAIPSPTNPGCTGTKNLSAIPPSYLNCGTQSSQTFGTYPSGLPTEPSPGSYTSVTEYIPGSVKLTSAASGSGILIVDGDLEINGGLNWYGLILVRGQISFTGGAGQSTNLYGAVLAGKDITATDQSVTDTFGGSINFHYDVCALNAGTGTAPPQLLATHEIMY
jgi:hypothetical protein